MGSRAPRPSPINGQRLTALSAIRAAGDAILVDNKPLVPPYTVLAVGDGKRLSTAFQDSADGQYLHALQENFGIRTSISVRGGGPAARRAERDRTYSSSRDTEHS